MRGDEGAFRSMRRTALGPAGDVVATVFELEVCSFSLKILVRVRPLIYILTKKIIYLFAVGFSAGGGPSAGSLPWCPCLFVC